MVLEGKSVFGGIAIGPISLYHRQDHVVKRTKVEDTAAETAVLRRPERRQRSSCRRCTKGEKRGGRDQCHDF